MAIDPFSIAVGLVAGGALGAVFFGGLWWTVRRGLASARAGLWFGGSFLARFGVLAAGLYLLAHDNPGRGMAAGIAVIVARFVASRGGARVPAVEERAR